MRFYISMRSQLLIAVVIGVLAVAGILVLVLLFLRLFSETRAKTVRTSELTCRNCGSPAVRPSFRSGVLDNLFFLFSQMPYRCEVCYWRFYVSERYARKFQDPAEQSVQTHTKNNP